MKDLFGNTKPVQIEMGEWWYNGRIIQEQNHPHLPKYISFDDKDGKRSFIDTHISFKEAVNYCLSNPCKTPSRFPHNYL